MSNKSLPIFYSFRRCPYAMRARLALSSSGVQCEIREVVLKDKPDELLTISPKGTVPVLLTADGKVLEESLDIMFWALAQRDPANWYHGLNQQQRAETDALIANNDGEFKYYLDRYKYADRYPQHSQQFYRQQGEKTLLMLEQRLQQTRCLLSESWTLADIALLPFVRQFAFVDEAWFEQSAYPAVRQWLTDFLDSELFSHIMAKYPQWQTGDKPLLFP